MRGKNRRYKALGRSLGLEEPASIMGTDSPSVAPFPKVVTLSDEWDIARREEIRDILEDVGAEPCLILDLTAVSYMDSSALNAFMRLQRLRDDHDLPPAYVAISRQVQRVWEIVGFQKHFPTFSTLQEACSAALGHERKLDSHDGYV